MQSANQKYRYDDVYFGKTLAEWVTLVHAHISDQSGWAQTTVQPASFGFDNLCCSLAHLLIALRESRDLPLRNAASLVHMGWTENYIFWRDHQPWTLGPYRAPYNPLGDERRDMCAKTEFENLPLTEQQKDLDIAEFVLRKI